MRRTVIITGANSGIGKAAALKFASQGHHVIMACRDTERSAKARQETVEASGSKSVELIELDVSSFSSIQKFCSAFKASHRQLDILIHNAGYFHHGITSYQLSADGLELTFATNAFGPFLMTELLRDCLAQSDDSRVLNACTTNIKHFFDPKREIEFDNLQGEFKDSRPYSVYKMYGDSKIGLLLLTYKMAEEYKQRGVKVNALMIPATKVSKETLKKFTGHYKILGRLSMNLNPFALLPDDVAACYYHLCTSPEFRNVTGALINTKHEIIHPAKSDQPLAPIDNLKELLRTRHTPAYANNPKNIERMWELSKQVIRAHTKG